MHAPESNTEPTRRVACKAGEELILSHGIDRIFYAISAEDARQTERRRDRENTFTDARGGNLKLQL